jgi:paraquat-inducible protein B
MSKRASPTAIGAFVVGAVALAVVGLIIFGGINFFRRPLTYVMFFDTTVSGLSVGAPVEFRGVKLGQVSRIESRWGTEWIGVFVQLDPRALRGTRAHDVQELGGVVTQAIAEKGLRAQLKWQNFITGQLYVALDLYPKTPIKLVGLDRSVPDIPVVPTTLQQFTEQAEKILTTLRELPLDELFRSAVETVNGVKAMVPEARTAVRSTSGVLVNTEKLTRRLGEDAGPLLASFKDTSDAARLAVTDVSQDTRRLLQRVEAEVATLNALIVKTEVEIGSVATSVRSASEQARETLEKAKTTLGAVDGAVDGDSRLGYELVRTLQDLGSAARSLRGLTDTLTRHPEALLQGNRPSGGE